MKIAIVGGGSSAHLLSVLLSIRDHEVRVLTHKPAAWRNELTLVTDDGDLHGRIACATDDPLVAFEGAEAAFLCMPVHQYPSAVRWILPALAKNPQCLVGPVYGQAGFDWVMRAAARDAGVPVPRHFAIGLLPWITRTLSYGERAVYYGMNAANTIATQSAADFDFLQEKLLDDLAVAHWGKGRFTRAPSFLALTLTVDNQIIHPGRCYALMQAERGWERQEDVPLLYADWEEVSTGILRTLDRDYSAVRSALHTRFGGAAEDYGIDFLTLQSRTYEYVCTDIAGFFKNEPSLARIRPPLKQMANGLWYLDVNHRFLKDDFAFGLEICNWFAAQLGCEAPAVSGLLSWFHTHIQPHQDAIIAPGTPEAYGFTLDDVIAGR